MAVNNLTCLPVGKLYVNWSRIASHTSTRELLQDSAEHAHGSGTSLRTGE